tara:strand:- start:788 stop:1048 length:261 start_codon:yes stop_codon:yes gene_type:complete
LILYHQEQFAKQHGSHTIPSQNRHPFYHPTLVALTAFSILAAQMVVYWVVRKVVQLVARMVVYWVVQMVVYWVARKVVQLVAQMVA